MRLVICVVFLSCVGCYQYIDSGNVGVRVNASGTKKGIDPKPIGVGRAWYNPLYEQIHEFPVYEQNVLWSGDESITVSSSQSAQINIDIGLTYEIADEKVPVLFDKLRKDINYISHQWMRNHVREAVGRSAAHMDTMAILGEGKDQLLDKAKLELNATLKEYGITIKMLSLASAPRPEQKIQASIDATITAKQLAIQAENKVAQSKAEADQSIEQARGRAQSMIVEAEASLKKAELEAQGNQALAKSLTPQVIQYTAIQKWDGVLPKLGGSAVPFVSVGKDSE